jgi:hypothetical protein
MKMVFILDHGDASMGLWVISWRWENCFVDRDALYFGHSTALWCLHLNMPHPQSTHNGNGHFLVHIPSWIEKLAQPGEVGMHAHPISQILPSLNNVVVYQYSPAENRHSSYFYSTTICTLWPQPQMRSTYKCDVTYSVCLWMQYLKCKHGCTMKNVHGSCVLFACIITVPLTVLEHTVVYKLVQ